MAGGATSWDDGGAGGLRVVIDLGMQHLMNDAELRSLALQCQISYSKCVNLCVEPCLVLDGAPPGRAGGSGGGGDGRGSADGGDASPAPLRPVRLMLSSAQGPALDALRRDRGFPQWPISVTDLPFHAAAAAAAASGDVRKAPAGDGGISDLALREAAPPQPPPPLTPTPPLPKIVVMSPDATEVFTGPPAEDEIYVVGGLCDYKRIANATLDRAAAAGVCARRLPIEESLGDDERVTVDILTVNQTVEALCRAWHSGGDWAAALRAVIPARKFGHDGVRPEDHVTRAAARTKHPERGSSHS